MYLINRSWKGWCPSIVNFFDLIETLWEGFNGEDLAGHLQKVDPNESGGLDRFAFVRWYVDKEFPLESEEEAEYLVGWACKVSLMAFREKYF